jgi:hypothetical protein
MKNGLCAAVAILLVLCVIGMSWAGPAKSGAFYAGKDSDTQTSVSAGGDPQWTLIFYLAADNQQESYADATISQLLNATARISNHPQVLILLDRLSVPGTEVFEIVDGEIVPLASDPEQNTADGEVIEDFSTYALGRAEHENIAFVMKSEGFGWRGIGRDNTHDEALDDRLMPAGDLAEALIAAQDSAGKDVDLLVLEGSIMAFIEVVYELRGAAPYLLATQSKIQPDGLPWEMVIEDLSANPEMSSEALGIAIVDDHLEYYSDKGNNGVPRLDTSTNFAAMTVFDLSHMDAVLAAHGKW